MPLCTFKSWVISIQAHFNFLLFPAERMFAALFPLAHILNPPVSLWIWMSDGQGVGEVEGHAVMNSLMDRDREMQGEEPTKHVILEKAAITNVSENNCTCPAKQTYWQGCCFCPYLFISSLLPVMPSLSTSHWLNELWMVSQCTRPCCFVFCAQCFCVNGKW